MIRAWQQLKNIYHYLQAQLWRAVYGWPDRGLTMYGVTGTNGKTTTCHLVASMLQAAHGAPAVGMLTTIAFWLGEEKIINETKMTTLPSRAVFSYLRQMRHRGVRYVVLELTSHALDQHRVAGVELSGAIILNVAREHLDYHGTMLAYASAKEKIIDLLKADAPVVGKVDDPFVAPMLTRARQRGFRVVEFTATASTPPATLPGAVNQENTTAAALLMEAAGIASAAITQGIAALPAVPGRMQWIELPSGARALIDYAVTPDALERLYRDVRQSTRGKIYAVLGACGLRDRGKRPDMARVVAQYADELVITREDPWTESEEQIFSDLEKGLTATTIPWQRIVDRRDALNYFVARAQSGDVIVATGKGAETGMGIGKQVIPWNEAEIILELARNAGA